MQLYNPSIADIGCCTSYYCYNSATVTQWIATQKPL